MNEEIRREASVPMQSRVDVRTLAEICWYFEKTDNDIRTVSQLVSWGLEMMVGTLRINEKLPQERPSVESAYQFLEARGLTQKKMMGKMKRALGFEHMRMEGISPREYASADHKNIHNNPNWTGEGAPEFNKGTGVVSKEDVAKAVEIYKEVKTKDIRAQVDKQIKEIMEGSNVEEVDGVKIITPQGTPSGIVGEEEMEAYKKREKGREELEEIKKRSKARDRREEKLLDELHLLKEKENESDTGLSTLPKGKETSGGSEGEGTDTGRDSEGDG